MYWVVRFRQKWAWVDAQFIDLLSSSIYLDHFVVSYPHHSLDVYMHSQVHLIRHKSKSESSGMTMIMRYVQENKQEQPSQAGAGYGHQCVLSRVIDQFWRSNINNNFLTLWGLRSRSCQIQNPDLLSGASRQLKMGWRIVWDWVRN